MVLSKDPSFLISGLFLTDATPVLLLNPNVTSVPTKQLNKLQRIQQLKAAMEKVVQELPQQTSTVANMAVFSGQVSAPESLVMFKDDNHL
jgi:hypothetical protein